MDMSAILEFVKPVPGNETWDYALYFLFFVGLVAIAFMNSKGARQIDSYFVTLATFFVVLDKLYVFGFLFAGPDTLDFADPNVELSVQQRADIHVQHMGSYIIRVLMFVLPLVVVGSTRSSRVRFFAGIFALTGAAYSFGRWFFQLRNEADLQPQTMLFMQGALFIIVIGELLSHWYRLRNSRIDG
ncbi:MAG: hypothetical protein CUN55_07280 [Phototrophicales bacterium]|nr:MAG: hypothetical protein CUN55_07280 [Phototrophicales bacterium]